VLSEKTSVTELGEETVFRVHFLDEGTMDILYSFDLDRLEQGLSCISCLCDIGERADGGELPPPSNEFIVVGARGGHRSSSGRTDSSIVHAFIHAYIRAYINIEHKHTYIIRSRERISLYSVGCSGTAVTVGDEAEPSKGDRCS
jgi:hypothetical protein